MMSAERIPYSDDDAMLDFVESWLNQNGWEKLGTPEFDQALKDAGIDRDSLTI